MLPPETVQVFGSGENSGTGPTLVCKDTELSSEFHPLPVTVTSVPVGPLVELRTTLGPPLTMNGWEATAPPESLTVTKELPEPPTVNWPVTMPAEFSVQLGENTDGPCIPGVQVAVLPVKPDPATVIVKPTAPE